MITMPSFRVLQPKTEAEAIEMLAAHDDVRILAGSTDIVINLRNKLLSPKYALDVTKIASMHGIDYSETEGLCIGAATTLSEIAENPTIRTRYEALAKAAGLVAGPNIRNMATLGGNICLDTRCQWYNQSYFWRKSCNFCLKKDGDICHVAPGGSYCWAAYSGDTAPALLALGASIKIVSALGERVVDLKDFFVLDGIKKYNLAPNEIVTEIHIPAKSANQRGFYKKLRIRDSVDYPLAGAAVVGRLDKQGRCTNAQVAITAVNPAPLIVKGVEELMVDREPSEELFEKVADMARKTAKPMKTSLSTMPYRRHMIGVFVKQGLSEIFAN
ncbi:MAG: FAD binding domain-containing protein [Blastocatellia bacterium]|nr:FAD binding domain-containing protein [Blastocatellia bacterium]